MATEGARSANRVRNRGKRIYILNHGGLALFCFPTSISMPPCFHVSILPCLHASMLHTTMTNSRLTLLCLVDTESIPFPVDVDPSKTVDHLKRVIKAAIPNTLGGIEATGITLWRVEIPPAPDDERKSIDLSNVELAEKLDPTDGLKNVFEEAPDKKTVSIIVQPPQPASTSEQSASQHRPGQALKRQRGGDEETASKRLHLDQSAIEIAIAAAGLSKKALVNGGYDLSRLDNRERVALLGFLGQKVGNTDSFTLLARSAFELRQADMEKLDHIKAPPSESGFPVVQTTDLYVRKTYKDLYSRIVNMFESIPHKQIIVTGTTGIGKSVFLVYLVIRLLADSKDHNPSIIIFHTRQCEECYVFGGYEALRYGAIKDFRPFLTLTNTWYLVDSALHPILDNARTVISASPKILYDEQSQYQNIDKDVVWRYYMAPWDLEELTACRRSVPDFEKVAWDIVEELYFMIGGVPRYVLMRPYKELMIKEDDSKVVIQRSCQHLTEALGRAHNAEDLMQLFEKSDSLEFSSHLIHRWPVGDDHRDFRLEWASLYVADEIAKLLDQSSRAKMLKILFRNPPGSASGIIFESYVLRTFRDGGHTFELRVVETRELSTLKIPKGPSVEELKRGIPTSTAGCLWIPKSCNFACVDMLFSPRDLFQITVSKDHPIKGPPFQKLIQSLKGSQWINNPGEARFIFIVPDHVFGDFKAQNYLGTGGKIYEHVPADIKNVRQYVLKIDIESGASVNLQD